MHAEILHGGISHNIGTGRAPDSEGRREKRLLKIDGELVRQQSDLTRYVSVWWLTPAMDQLFNEGNSARRKFLDRLVYGFDPAHAARVARYERAMRERNALLAEPAAALCDRLRAGADAKGQRFGLAAAEYLRLHRSFSAGEAA
jgi:recombinational DNA repair ATPase RecF